MLEKGPAARAGAPTQKLPAAANEKGIVSAHEEHIAEKADDALRDAERAGGAAVLDFLPQVVWDVIDQRLATSVRAQVETLVGQLVVSNGRRVGHLEAENAQLRRELNQVQKQVDNMQVSMWCWPPVLAVTIFLPPHRSSWAC